MSFPYSYPQSRYAFRRAFNAPYPQPLGGLWTSPVKGFTRGVFDADPPWAIPDYIAAEADGVNGMGNYCGHGVGEACGLGEDAIVASLTAYIPRGAQLASAIAADLAKQVPIPSAVPSSMAKPVRAALQKKLESVLQAGASKLTAAAPAGAARLTAVVTSYIPQSFTILGFKVPIRSQIAPRISAAVQRALASILETSAGSGVSTVIPTGTLMPEAAYAVSPTALAKAAAVTQLPSKIIPALAPSVATGPLQKKIAAALAAKAAIAAKPKTSVLLPIALVGGAALLLTRLV